jgi:DNA-binding HxlR family transcriptional regulator
MLAKSLRELEADGFINRQAFAEVPPRVEYDLTRRGQSVAPIIDDLVSWAIREAMNVPPSTGA